MFDFTFHKLIYNFLVPLLVNKELPIYLRITANERQCKDDDGPQKQFKHVGVQNLQRLVHYLSESITIVHIRFSFCCN